MNNTPTPETDDLAITCYIDSVIEGVFGFRAVPIDDCRKLERERNSARAKFAAAIDGRDMANEEADKLREQNAKLRDIAEWFANQYFENDGDERWPSCPVTKKAQRLRAELDQLKEEAK
jgi:hypothetical protein